MSFEREFNHLKQKGKLLNINEFNNVKLKAICLDFNGEKNIILSSISKNIENIKIKLSKLEQYFINKKMTVKLEIVDLNANFEIVRENFIKTCSINENIKKFMKQSIKEDNDIWNYLNTEKFIVLDTETTGTSRSDQVIELAAVKLENYSIIDTFREFIIPTVPISKGAEAVHGISKEFLEKNGKDAKDVFIKFKKFAEDYKIVGHNVDFDRKKIKYHSILYDINIDLKILFDTLKVSRNFMAMNNHKLADIIDRLNLREGLDSHSAIDDVIATVRYAAVLRNVYKEMHQPSLSLF